MRDLTVVYRTDEGDVHAVDKASFDVGPGERLGIVGESGSGKTTTALALIQMLRPPGRVTAGTASVGEVDLLRLGPVEIRRHRLQTVSYVPQGAMNSLNPVLTIGRQFRNALVDHDLRVPETEMRERVRAGLAGVELDPHVAELYPHELSGGMKQRVCIAIAMLLGPQLIIADEPTSALDVVTQRQVMETLGQQQQATGAGLILIGHDIGLMAQFVDLLAVMYAGRIVEIGTIREVLETPRHPYAQALVASVPRLTRRGELHGIAGVTPSLRRLPEGCAFHPRCAHAFERCRRERPVLDGAPGRHRAACHLTAGSLPEQAA